MLLFSKTTEVFLSKVKSLVRDIIRTELKLEMHRSRIFYNRFYFPLNIVVFEDNLKLGYFDFRFYEIGLNKRLMYEARPEVLKNIIRHELAHYLAYIKYGTEVLHGEKFKEICREYNWDQEVEKAYGNIDIENEKHFKNDDHDKLISKIKKLLALANSENQNESELATMKANQLLLEHNIDLNKNINADEEEFYVLRVLENKRKTAKHIAIFNILKTFYVSPVFNHGKGYFYLEVIGNKTSVELADYVANFLNNELETLWKVAQKENPNLCGLAHKNSFFIGISKGYVEKIELQKHKLASKNDLILIEKNLNKAINMAYPRLSSSHSNSSFHPDAHQAGKLKGANLSINPALKNKNSTTKLLSLF